MIIRTDRLILRPFEIGDFNWFKQVAMDEEVKVLLPGVVCDSDEIVKASICLYIRGDFSNDFYYVICDKNNRQLGVIIATRVSRDIIDVSYFLQKDSRHCGYMTEAVQSFVSYAKTVNALYKFRFLITAKNVASLNVVKRLNARIEEAFGHCFCYL